MKQESLSFHETMYLLVSEYGESILMEPRLEGMIADLLGGEYLYHSVMRRAVQTHVGQRIVEISKNTNNIDIAIDALRHSFQEENFYKPNIASYMIDSFAYALGLIPYVETDFTESEEDNIGEPSFIEEEDGEFCGYSNTEGERCGFGILKETMGSYYAGEWNLNMRMGFGIGFSETRKKYAGQWRINQKNGIGIEMQENGIIYSGQWKNGKKHGVGTLFFPNGESLNTRFENDQICDCQGIWYLQDKSFVQGKMTIKGPTGLCFHTLLDGTIKDEYWNEGKLIDNI